MTRSDRARWGVLACVMIVAASCGNRLSRSDILSQNAISATEAEEAGASGGSRSVSGVGERSGGEASLSDGARATEPGGDGSAAGSGEASAGGAGATAGGDKSPVVLGLINNETGIGANVTLPVREVWQAWAKSVNARGGIKGHPVQVLVADCANNTSLNLPLARDLVEKRGAIALSFECSEITGLPEYAKSKRIPIIGSLVSGPEWNSNAMLFPTHPTSAGGAKGQGLATKQLGVKKVAILYCVESPTCKRGSDAYADAARANGVEVVYHAGTTVTQPDYTSECLQARNAGADALYIGGLPDQAIRVARSCARQQFKPTYIAAPAGDEQLQIPELDGMASFSQSFPWFLHAGSPALEEYGQALAKYAPKLVTNGTGLQTSGWVAAKVFQRAVELGVPSDRPPTSQDILNGLWGIKNDTFGGLYAGPLARTFTRDQPTPDANCAFLIKRQGAKWVAPNGSEPVCG